MSDFVKVGRSYVTTRFVRVVRDYMAVLGDEVVTVDTAKEGMVVVLLAGGNGMEGGEKRHDRKTQGGSEEKQKCTKK